MVGFTEREQKVLEKLGWAKWTKWDIKGSTRTPCLCLSHLLRRTTYEAYINGWQPLPEAVREASENPQEYGVFLSGKEVTDETVLDTIKGQLAELANALAEDAMQSKGNQVYAVFTLTECDMYAPIADVDVFFSIEEAERFLDWFELYHTSRCSRGHGALPSVERAEGYVKMTHRSGDGKCFDISYAKISNFDFSDWLYAVLTCAEADNGGSEGDLHMFLTMDEAEQFLDNFAQEKEEMYRGYGLEPCTEWQKARVDISCHSQELSFATDARIKALDLSECAPVKIPLYPMPKQPEQEN